MWWWKQKTHTCFLTKHLKRDDCLLRSMTILIISTRTQLQFYIQMVTIILKVAFRMTVKWLNEFAGVSYFLTLTVLCNVVFGVSQVYRLTHMYMLDATLIYNINSWIKIRTHVHQYLWMIFNLYCITLSPYGHTIALYNARVLHFVKMPYSMLFFRRNCNAAYFIYLQNVQSFISSWNLMSK
jgi:hypothetical protein